MPEDRAVAARAAGGAERQTLLRGALLLLAGLAYALMAHWSTARGGHGTLGAVLAIGPVGLLALMFLWRTQHLPGLVVWLVAVALIASQWQPLRAHFAWLYLIQQVGLYALLGVFFGRTLARGRVPLCTQMALHVHGTMSAAAQRYTRRVTLAWTVFFAMLASALIILFVAGPLRVWSAFANFGAPLLMVLMFVIENAVRRFALPGLPHAGVIATIQASAAVGFGWTGSRS